MPAPAAPDHVLVTGGAGFIGSALVRRLLSLGQRVTVLDDLSSGSVRNLPAHPGLTLIEGSVLDAATLSAACRSATRVYHLAGIVGMRRVAHEARQAYDVAVRSTEQLVELEQRAELVLFSSSAVYALRGADPARESAPLDAEDIARYDGGTPGYAAGKAAMEALGAAAATRGRRVLMVRPFNVVGPHQSSAYGMVLPTFLRAAARGRPLVVYDDGQQTRCFSCVETFVDCLLRLTGHSTCWEPGANIVNIGSSRATPILELARTVLAVTGADVPLVMRPYGDDFPGRQDTRSRVPDGGRLTAAIGAVSWPSVRSLVARAWARGDERPLVRAEEAAG